MQNIIYSVRDALIHAERLLIATHINPDGDAAGSAVALAYVALHVGKQVRFYLPSGLPSFLNWLVLPAGTVSDLSSLDSWIPDLVACVDCGDAERAGEEIASLMKGILPAETWQGVRTINIDHHLSNPEFADINWVEPHRSATGELIGLLAENLGIALSGPLGEAVYLALVSDTGNFTYSNTGPETLSMAARIMTGDLDIAAFTSNYENNWSLSRMHLWGKLLSEIQLYEGGAIAVSIVPLEYLKEYGLSKEALDGFASWLRKIKGVQVGLFVREEGAGQSKVSLRSMGDIDVRLVAQFFGGGGHAAASGAEIAASPQNAAKQVLEKLKLQM